MDASDDAWLTEIAALVDLMGAAGDGNDVGNWTLAKLGIDCAEAV